VILLLTNLSWSWNASAIDLLVWINEKKDLSKMIFLRGEQILLFMVRSWSGMHQLARQDEIVLLTKVDKLCEMTKLSPKKYSGKKKKNKQWAQCLWTNKGGPHYK